MTHHTTNSTHRRKALMLCALTILLAQAVLAQGSDPEAIFQDARIVHNVQVNGVRGIRVHANFIVKYGLGNPCRMIAYFYFVDGRPLKSADKKFSTVRGDVSVARSFTPAYDPAYYKEFTLFVPYDALNMAPGDEYELKFHLQLYDESARRFFGRSPFYSFHMNVP